MISEVSPVGPLEFAVVDLRDLDVDVDAVEQGAGDALAVGFDLAWRAAAFAFRIAEVAAGAGVHGGDEHEAGGEGEAAGGAGDGDLAVFERLAQDLERGALNSGSSSRKRTPWWARETSPGRGLVPPPSRPASEMVWCGERNGRVARKPRRVSSRPATEWILVTSMASSRSWRA